MKNIVKDEKYLQIRNEILTSIQDKYKTDKVDIYYSPDNEYRLIIEYFNPEENQGWKYSRGTITQLRTENELVLIRNFGSFPFEWILKDKESFLLCGQDYQGFSIVDLKIMKVIDYVPAEFYEGRGFCWAEIHYTQGIDVLVVGGCYWGDEYEIVFYDFSNPLRLPYKELKRIKPYEKIIGWQDKCNFEYEDEDRKKQIVKIL
ncbi:hypothetical protein [Paenibacillus crassostreae]|uniref:Uncharacterized protein n=1 Tax=Paenibacillus crassostreae TaxID=1763538 RepID=A0A167BWA3_9BACL|nr:hypothetical protein [Paenibacillus crassostreae]AOZ92567.1 hypothetical protein LPB68_10185 [Paenibacillus crassostreae]OAB72516.1 hypothetical protein PNBC_16630 [Paenibacillus crassostreae]